LVCSWMSLLMSQNALNFYLLKLWKKQWRQVDIMAMVNKCFILTAFMGPSRSSLYWWCSDHVREKQDSQLIKKTNPNVISSHWIHQNALAQNTPPALQDIL
jgi:hypothetical protein